MQDWVFRLGTKQYPKQDNLGKVYNCAFLLFYRVAASKWFESATETGAEAKKY